MNLMRTGRLNSVLLALFFIERTVGAFTEGSYGWAALGVIAIIFTVVDVVLFHRAIK